MDYNSTLVEGRFLKRYKRFFADVQIGNEQLTAHVPNTGSLKGVCEQNRLCRLQRSDNPERKLKWTLEQVETPTSWVGVNTHSANTLVWEAINTKSVPEWRHFSHAIREVKINTETRLDFKLSSSEKSHFIEVKSVTLAEGSLALFPDAVTTRGQKHIEELMRLIQQGASAELLFVVQRTDCVAFSPAHSIDPEYGRLLVEAAKNGLTVKAKPAFLSESRLLLQGSKNLELRLF
jgi:sugar fermentation stimulation protein A